MATKPATAGKVTGLAGRFGAFIAERYPFALGAALDAFAAAAGARDPRDEAAIEALRPALRRGLGARLRSRAIPPGLPDTTPGTPAQARLEHAAIELLNACDGFLRRAAIQASLTEDERREI